MIVVKLPLHSQAGENSLFNKLCLPMVSTTILRYLASNMEIGILTPRTMFNYRTPFRHPFYEAPENLFR